MAYFNNVLRNDNAPNNFDYGTLAQIDGFYQQNSDECHPLRQDIDYAQNYQRNHQSSFTKNDASISTYSLLNYMTHNEQELKRPLFAELQPNNIAHTVANHPPISYIQSVRSENKRLVHQGGGKKFCKRKKRLSVEEHEERKRLTRIRANGRERNRMHDLNRALDALRDRLSIFSFDRPLSKIDALRLGANYIAVLTEILETENEKPDSLKMALTLTKGLSFDSTDHISRKLKVDRRILNQMRTNRIDDRGAAYDN